MPEGGILVEEQEKKLTVGQKEALKKSARYYSEHGLSDLDFQAFKKKGVEEAKRNNGHVPDRDEWEEIRTNLRRMLGHDVKIQATSFSTNNKEVSNAVGVFSENTPREQSDSKLQ